jgi:polyvinyl alcohol dehydrogenase (cytochrome)
MRDTSAVPAVEGTPVRKAPGTRTRRRNRAARILAVTAVAAVLPLAATATPAWAGPVPGDAQATAGTATDWPFAGRDLSDTRDAPTERSISPATASTLKPRWTLTTGGDVTTTPTVVNGRMYVPDYGGNLWAVDKATGAVVWKNPISRYSGVAGDISRISPAYWGGRLVTGEGVQGLSSTLGAFMLGIDARTGNPLWRTQVDSDPTAIITTSPVAADGVAYVGVSSKAEAINEPTTFRGSVLALDAVTGRVLWKQYTVPQGYTGGAV